MPMFIQGLAGLSRRMYDGGQQYAHASDITHWNEFKTISAFILGLAQIPFILNIFITLSTKKSEDRNPWKSTTIEWSAPSPLPHVNFESALKYTAVSILQVPEKEEDYYPQTSP